MRVVTIVIASLAVLLTGFVGFRHFETVSHLREAYGVTEFPLFEPMLLVPLVFVALAVGFLRTRRDAWALGMSITSLAVVSFAFVAQGAGAIGGP